MANAEIRFRFGRNWRHFVAHAVDDRRIATARDSMRRLLGMESLEGRVVVDIGCGSGLFSLSAIQLGARQVVGFDYDEDSVRASTTIREAQGVSAERWRITQGSVLDEAFMASLPRAEVVYAWGVLHHTGRMWDAIRNAAMVVAPAGLFAIAIYNRVGTSALWARIKRLYCQSPMVLQWLAEATYLTAYAGGLTLTGRNPVRVFREYRERRGMSLWHDVRDWLGGYPYEYATVSEIFDFVRPLGFKLIRVVSTNRTGCNEFVFEREPAELQR